jgi:hypothetical protein
VSVPVIPEPARIVVSVLTPHQDLVADAAGRLVPELGPVEEQIGPLPFGYTSYYDKEMGPGIERWLWSFRNLVDLGELARIKLLTNALEDRYSESGNRRMNLDPSLMTLGNFVLATGKNNAHRIYLRDGVFGDLTLIYKGGSYRPLSWTYPDYADPSMIAILNGIRERYKCILRMTSSRPDP